MATVVSSVVENVSLNFTDTNADSVREAEIYKFPSGLVGKGVNSLHLTNLTEEHDGIYSFNNRTSTRLIVRREYITKINFMCGKLQNNIIYL